MRGLTHRLQPDASPNHPRPGWTDVREYPWPNDPDLIPLLWPIVPDYSRLPLVEHLQGVIVKRPCIGEEKVSPGQWLPCLNDPHSPRGARGRASIQ